MAPGGTRGSRWERRGGVGEPVVAPGGGHGDPWKPWGERVGTPGEKVLASGGENAIEWDAMGASGQTTLTERERRAARVELLGTRDRTLDDRGRLSVPTAFRPAFADGAVVVRWPGPCVAVFPVDDYREMEASMRDKQRNELADGRARTALNALADHLHLDASGRLFVADDLRRFAGFDREVVVVGQRTRLELWSRATHDAEAEESWQALVAHIAAEAL